MINVTDNAVRQLQSLLPAREENSRKGLRVQVAKGGCSGLHYEMTLDEKKEGDAVVERDGMQFFIDGESVSYLRGATLDFTDGLTGTGFQVVNPNASRTCGCGSSFETSQSA
jgi:iron-sulfur cluster assembly protein